MNEIQIQKVHEILVNSIMNNAYTRGKAPFIYEVYSSDDSKKIVIKCTSNNELIDFYTIDYEKQEHLPNCNGLNTLEDGVFFLNCEAKPHLPKIFYTLNKELTEEFNKLFD